MPEITIEQVRDILVEEFSVGTWEKYNKTIQACVTRAVGRIAPLLANQPRAMSKEEMNKIARHVCEAWRLPRALNVLSSGRGYSREASILQRFINALSGELIAPEVCGRPVSEVTAEKDAEIGRLKKRLEVEQRKAKLEEQGTEDTIEELNQCGRQIRELQTEICRLQQLIEAEGPSLTKPPWHWPAADENTPVDTACWATDDNYVMNVDEAIQSLSGEGGKSPIYDEDAVHTLIEEVERLRKNDTLIRYKVGGETLGDTLIRFSDLLGGVRQIDGVDVEDWKSWALTYLTHHNPGLRNDR